MTRDQARVGVRVRDRGTQRLGTITSIDTLGLDIVLVQYDESALSWVEIEDLDRLRGAAEELLV